jgi:hypothetical protein
VLHALLRECDAHAVAERAHEAVEQHYTLASLDYRLPWALRN